MMNPSTVKITTLSVVRPTDYLSMDPARMRGPIPAILPENQVPATEVATRRDLLEERYIQVGSGACIAYVPMGWVFRFDRERDYIFGRRSD